MKNSSFFFRLLCVVSFCILAGTQAPAAVPGTPTNMTAQYEWQRLNATTWGAGIRLTWDYEDMSAPQPHYFDVFHAYGLETDYTAFELFEGIYVRTIDSLFGDWYDGYRIAPGRLSPGEHSFYVASRNDDGWSAPSNIAMVVVPDTLSLFFTSYPTMKSPGGAAFVGQPYTFPAAAQTWATGKSIRYMVLPASQPLPDGLTIDEETGVLSWTPTEKGVVEFIIRATFTDVPGLMEDMPASIYAFQCTTGSVLGGNVTDQNGQPVQSGYVVIMPAGSEDSSRVPSYSARIYDGRFDYQLDEGQYILYVYGGDFEAGYYENASTIEEATVVTVGCGEQVNVDIEVRRPGRFVVSGRVADNNGNGLPAEVLFRGFNPQLPANMRETSARYFSTHTNQNGEYAIELNDSYHYIAYAVIGDTAMLTNGEWRSNVQIQFYDHVETMSEATELVLTQNLTDINFDFTIESFNNGIAGRVSNTQGQGVEAYVSGYRVSGNNNERYSVTTRSDAAGNYSLLSLKPGRYVVMVYPIDSRGALMPGYYHEDGTAVPSWADATHITVSAQALVDDIDVVLPNVDTSAFGGGLLNGNVRGSGGRIGKGDGTVQSESAIVGALVTLIDGAGTVTRYNLSDGTGTFSLSALPAGTYTLIIDKIGFQPYKTTITIDGTLPVLVDATLVPEAVTGVGETASQTLLAKTYPNPAGNSVTLMFRAAPGTARISVVNTAGTEVLSLRAQTVDGDNTLLIDTQSLAAGAYIVRVVTGDVVSTVPVQIVR